MRRRAAILVTIGLLAGVGASGCAVARPSVNVGAEPHPAEEAARDAGTSANDVGSTYLVLRLGERRLYLMDHDPGTPIESFPIAIGREGLETPVGHFQVEEMVEHPDFVQVAEGVPLRVIKRIPPGPTNPLGERWIGFAHGDGWTVGIHGTPHPELLGRAVSHGCVRMRNADVIQVYEHVAIGTTVIVEP